MTAKKLIPLDELDQKIFEEMPFIMNTMAAWGNKVAGLFTPYHDEIECAIKENIKGKRFWQVIPFEKNNYYPFCQEYSTNNKIKSLEPKFLIYNKFRIIKKVRNKYKAWLIVDYGYWMNTVADDDSDQANRFYIGFYQSERYQKECGTIMSKEFYRSHKEKLIDYDIEWGHPQNDPDDIERIELQCSQLDQEKIDAMINTFVSSILIPILKKIQ